MEVRGGTTLGVGYLGARQATSRDTINRETAGLAAATPQSITPRGTSVSGRGGTSGRIRQGRYLRIRRGPEHPRPQTCSPCLIHNIVQSCVLIRIASHHVTSHHITTLWYHHRGVSRTKCCPRCVRVPLCTVQQPLLCTRQGQSFLRRRRRSGEPDLAFGLQHCLFMGFTRVMQED